MCVCRVLPRILSCSKKEYSEYSRFATIIQFVIIIANERKCVCVCVVVLQLARIFLENGNAKKLLYYFFETEYSIMSMSPKDFCQYGCARVCVCVLCATEQFYGEGGRESITSGKNSNSLGFILKYTPQKEGRKAGRREVPQGRRQNILGCALLRWLRSHLWLQHIPLTIALFSVSLSPSLFGFK